MCIIYIAQPCVFWFDPHFRHFHKGSPFSEDFEFVTSVIGDGSNQYQGARPALFSSLGDHSRLYSMPQQSRRLRSQPTYRVRGWKYVALQFSTSF